MRALEARAQQAVRQATQPPSHATPRLVRLRTASRLTNRQDGIKWFYPVQGIVMVFVPQRAVPSFTDNLMFEIRAAGPGKVIWAGRSPYDTAWIVIIAHSSHLVSWYAHIDNSPGPVVRAGQYVAKGQVIAFEGCTGSCTGPHLHCATQLDNVWVNPRLFV